ncbi:MAG: dihydroorotase [Cyanobacteria bacterium WB6_1B_304]|jgi:dihydroorotase|nr:dihydroorotase [Cyanobacteria bacterium WB6_1B_304]
MSAQLLRQIRVIDPLSNGDQMNDVLLIDGTIGAIAPHIHTYPDSTTIINGSGLILGPGLVDLYSHSGEPGFEERETLDSLCRAAASGGFTRIALLPTTNPVIDSPSVVRYLNGIHRNLPPDLDGYPKPSLSIWGALTRSAQGEQLGELSELATAGVVGFTDGQPLANGFLLPRILDYVQPLNLPIAFVPCDPRLTGGGVLREGALSTRLGLVPNPTIAETVAISTLIECVAAMATPIHLMRISTARGVFLIEQAQKQGLPITASTSWLHLLFNETVIAGSPMNPAGSLPHLHTLMPYDPNLRLDPPLGNSNDQRALQTGVNEGVIQAVAIDHRPYTYEEKTIGFASAPPGAIGLELALPLLWESLVERGIWSALTLWYALSTAPARCLHQLPPQVKAGFPSEFILFDPSVQWQVTSSSLQSRSLNTVWRDRQIKGKVIPLSSLGCD